MISPIAYAESLRIGSVDFVSPNEVKVQIDIEAPGNVALNSGYPSPFPRVGSYLIISCETGFLVGQVEWITIERSQFPLRKGLQDFGVVDLPFPLRKMSLTPLGVLRVEISDGESIYSFSRGIDIFPTVGDPVLLPNQKQLRSIVESGTNRRVRIGTSPSAADAVVCVDPDRLFGRHLAILGNTGSGKSCSVAGLIRWSIEAAKAECNEEKRSPGNSRFIILDPNGEYTRAFMDMENVNIFAVEAKQDQKIRQLQVPIWFWNINEWCSFSQASSKTQRPTLIHAIRTVREGINFSDGNRKQRRMRMFLRTIEPVLEHDRRSGDPWAGFPKSKSFFEKIRKYQADFGSCEDYNDEQNNAIVNLNDYIEELIRPRLAQYPEYDFKLSEIDNLINLVSTARMAFCIKENDQFSLDADIPLKFSAAELLKSINVSGEILGTSEHIDTLIMRIQTILSDPRVQAITECAEDLTLEKWLSDYLGPLNSTCGTITIIDLSLVPAEVVQIFTAVIARMILEALQRFRKVSNGKTLPTTLVMEEAHTFVRRYSDESEDSQTYSMCTKVFEKISREGRKFGLGLVLSSQRPSELSPTVLSQCNTFLLHRISNDRDQELVNKLVPDNLRGLLRELPTLPSQRAILLGWASELPVMVQMDYLPENQRPQSSDPDYWSTWTTTDSQQNVDWCAVVQDWQDTHTKSIDDEEDNSEEDSDIPF